MTTERTPLSKHVQTALDTLAEICKMPASEMNDRTYEKRSAAEEILRHYREMMVVKKIREGINITINGAVPVRPMTRAEVVEG